MIPHPQVPPPATPAGSRHLVRLLLAGCMAALAVGAVPLADWAAQEGWTADSAAIQAATASLAAADRAAGLAAPYGWLRALSRRIRAARFDAAQDEADKQQ